MILTFWYRYEILNVGKIITTVTGIFLPLYFTYLLIYLDDENRKVVWRTCRCLFFQICRLFISCCYLKQQLILMKLDVCVCLLYQGLVNLPIEQNVSVLLNKVYVCI